MSISYILEEIAATSSTNAKEAILRREKDNKLLRAVFAAAYNPMVSYYIKKIPEYQTGQVSPQLTLTEALDALGDLSSRKITGNAAISTLGWILSNCNAENASVIEKIIKRDLRCGCSDSIASRVWPGLVPTFDVMLCGKDITKIKYPAYAQLKCDGARVHLYYDGKEARAFSRTGKEFQLMGALNEAASKIMQPGECFDGELLVYRNGKVVDRKTGNGILNKASNGTISREEASMIVMVAWDIVDTSSTIPYSQRFESLSERILSGEQDKIELVPSVIVKNEAEAYEFFEEQLAAGEEGAILKNINHLWVPKRSKDLCKLKAVETADLVVVDIYEGTGKFKGMLGGLTCETSDGLLNVNVGIFQGNEMEIRSRFDRKYWVGSIVEVLYNAKIKSKGKDTWSLFLPRVSVVGKRFDKNVANTLEELA